MWTDEQLLAQGWTHEQIAIHRAEEAAKGIAHAVESQVPDALSVESIPPEPAPAVLAETFEAPVKTSPPIAANSTLPAIFLAAMLGDCPIFPLFDL
jgi:hypothetical protein